VTFGEFITPAFRMAVMWAAEWTCAACLEKTYQLQVDHFRPRHAGGTGVMHNLLPLCPECNQVKSCYWPWHGYHPFDEYDDPARAHDIHLAGLAWLEARHPGADLWGPDGEPGPWAYRRLPGGCPLWIAEMRVSSG